MVEVVFENFVNYLRSGNTDKLNIISFQQNQQHKINLSTQLIFYRILTKTVVQLIQYAWNKTKFYPEQTIQPPPNQKQDFDKYLEEEQEKFDQSIIKGTERPKSIYYNPENQNFQETILHDLLETQALYAPGSQTQAPDIEETKVLSQLEQTGQKFQQIDQYNQLLQQINQVNSKQQLREIAKQYIRSIYTRILQWQKNVQNINCKNVYLQFIFYIKLESLFFGPYVGSTYFTVLLSQYAQLPTCFSMHSSVFLASNWVSMHSSVFLASNLFQYAQLSIPSFQLIKIYSFERRKQNKQYHNFIN
ncbi:Hypothetical_protein [Hexamita inflata]|uniref:Hypothetical_protein n=1 Tax=Hexamita inflata TaxID=28002 RepID=A0AA86TMX3_9EUKA|nr:Hypothetical protein HINF_LOCUS9856 [Hexamita inflata]